MQEFISALLAILGTLLVLGGAVVAVVGKAVTPVSDPASDPATRGGKLLGFLGRVNGADRLIAWGVLLLVLAAIAAGAISFNFGASAGTR